MRNIIHAFFLTQMELCERLFANEKLTNFMREQNFEIAMFEHIDHCRTLYLQHINVTNYVISLPMALPEFIATALGLPGRSICSFFNTDWDPTMTLKQRIFNYFTAYVIHFFLRPQNWQKIAIQYDLKDYSPVEAIAKARYVFVNTDEFMEFPRPISHKTIYIGGIIIPTDRNNTLPHDLEQHFELAEKVVLVIGGRFRATKSRTYW